MLVYCDWIIKQVSDAMIASFNRNDGWVDGMGSIKFDLNEDGSYRSPKKTMKVKVRGKWYIVTVEETE